MRRLVNGYKTIPVYCPKLCWGFDRQHLHAIQKAFIAVVYKIILVFGSDGLYLKTSKPTFVVKFNHLCGCDVSEID